MTNERALYSVAEIRRIEQTALASLPSFTLMQRAGSAAAAMTRVLLSDRLQNAKLLILAGPGNNGGDAFEMAAQLADSGLSIAVMFAGDAGRLPPDATRAYQHAQASTSITITPLDHGRIATTDWTLVVDGLFGIGLARPLQDDVADAIAAVNALRCPVLALDVPSGLNADTGNIVGDDAGIALRATHTITFIGDKPGLHTGDGRDYVGEVVVAALDIASHYLDRSAKRLNDVALFAACLKPRVQNSHKGSFGDVIVLGGASGMVGAAVLAARTAAKSGAGRVFIASPDNALAYDNAQPEIMCRPAHEMDFTRAAVVVGPGLGTSREAHDLLSKAIGTHAPLVIDADALNIIAAESALQNKLRLRRGVTLITPHPLEAARLLNVSTQDIQTDRLAAAHALAVRFNAIAILKGSGTVIATPAGQLTVNATGNPALATAGAGDVLSGLCGALLAQGWPAEEAALGAVWLHGKAADDLVESGTGPIGVTAGELIPCIRAALNRLVTQHAIRQGGQPKS
jgi:hydroxyethylthiazole kinase-like uncharacterized protein yjeF